MNRGAEGRAEEAREKEDASIEFFFLPSSRVFVFLSSTFQNCMSSSLLLLLLLAPPAPTSIHGNENSPFFFSFSAGSPLSASPSSSSSFPAVSLSSRALWPFFW